MNWKLVLALSSFGFATGVASLFGVNLSDPMIVLLVFLAFAWIIAACAPSRCFLHGFIAGVLGQIWITLFHAAYLFDMTRQGIGETPIRGLQPQVWYLLLGLFSALVKGLILGLFAFVAAQFVDRRERPAHF